APDRDQPVGELRRVARRLQGGFHDLRHELAAPPEKLEVSHDDLQEIVQVMRQCRLDLFQLSGHRAEPSYRIRPPTPIGPGSCKQKHGMSGPKIGITGSYGGLNLGDEAILQSMLEQVRKEVPDAEITVFSRDADDTKRRHKVERAVAVRKLSRSEVVPEVERLDL